MDLLFGSSQGSGYWGEVISHPRPNVLLLPSSISCVYFFFSEEQQSSLKAGNFPAPGSLKAVSSPDFEMAVLQRGVLFMGVRALLFGVYIRAPDFGELSNGFKTSTYAKSALALQPSKVKAFADLREDAQSKT